MNKKLSLITFHKSLKALIEKNTGLKCYDEIPKNAKPPFTHIEIIGKSDSGTKTMYLETIKVWVHVWAKQGKGSIGIYQSIQLIEECLTEKLCLGGGFDVVNQSSSELSSIQLDETQEKHAVIEYSFDVCYGYKIK